MTQGSVINLMHTSRTTKQTEIIELASTSGQRMRKRLLILVWLDFQPRRDFLSENFISGGPGAVFIVVDDRFAKARGLRQAGAPRNHRVENRIAKMFADFADHLLGQ